MFYEIFCIFNQYRLITIFQNSRFFEKSIYFIVHPKFFSVNVPFRIGDIPRLQKNTVSLSGGGVDWRAIKKVLNFLKFEYVEK